MKGMRKLGRVFWTKKIAQVLNRRDIEVIKGTCRPIALHFFENGSFEVFAVFNGRHDALYHAQKACPLVSCGMCSDGAFRVGHIVNALHVNIIETHAVAIQLDSLPNQLVQMISIACLNHTVIPDKEHHPVVEYPSRADAFFYKLDAPHPKEKLPTL